MKSEQQKKFEDQLHQIAMTANTYLVLSQKISSKMKKLFSEDETPGKLKILNDPYYQILQTTAKAYTDEAICCLATLLSNNPNEISIKKYDNKFNQTLNSKLAAQRQKALDLKVKDSRDWFVAHKDKRKNTNPYLNDLFGYKDQYIKDLLELSNEIFRIFSSELDCLCNNYFINKLDKSLSEIVSFCIKKARESK